MRDTVAVEVISMEKIYGAGAGAVCAISDISLTVPEREFVCIIGPSGCGKTSLLRCLCGLQVPSGGDVIVQGRRVTQPPPEMALVSQDYTRSLMPWLTVRKNVLLPLHHKNLSSVECMTLVEESVEAVGLERFLDYYPWQLSGGMQQRISIARALAYQPRILLMDEPFASVDAQTRADLEDLLLNVHATYGMTVIFVTHDVDEAVFLGNRVVALTKSPATVQQIVDIDLPVPRHQLDTKRLPRFTELRTELFSAIRPDRRQSTTSSRP